MQLIPPCQWLSAFSTPPLGCWHNWQTVPYTLVSVNEHFIAHPERNIQHKILHSVHSSRTFPLLLYNPKVSVPALIESRAGPLVRGLRAVQGEVHYTVYCILFTVYCILYTIHSVQDTTFIHLMSYGFYGLTHLVAYPPNTTPLLCKTNPLEIHNFTLL